MHILLIHGQGRTSFSMQPLGRRLARQGHAVQYFGYAAWRETFAQITQRLVSMIGTLIPANQTYVIISHSLGGIVARASLPALVEHPPAHLIMLAPPNQPPLLAQRLHQQFVYQLWTADCGQQLANPAFYAALPIPTIPTTVIAGTAGPQGPLSPFGNAVNDGVIAVIEAGIDATIPVILVPSIHTFIMNSRVVWGHVEGVLRGLGED